MVDAVIPQAQLLSSEKLRVNARLSRAAPEPGAVVLRAAGGDRRLVVTPAQADILTQDFSGYQTVPDVLVRTIAEHRCPPLREFYELIVQAHAAGILLPEPATTEETRPIHWAVRVPVAVALFISGGVAMVSAGFLAATVAHWRGPGTWVDVIGGWIAACALLSLGEVLAACVIATCGEVRANRLHWQTRFPHFRIDTGEAIMGGRPCELAVAGMRAAPILAGAAVAAGLGTGWFPALCGGALYMLAPWGPSAARQWLATHRRSPRFSIRSDFLFEPSHDDRWARWTARWRAAYAGFRWWGLTWTLIWGTWAAAAVLHCMPRTVATIAGLIRGAPRPVHLGAEYLLLAAIALGFFVWVWAGVRHWLLVRSWSQPPRGADARHPTQPPLTGDGAEILMQVPLFSGLDDECRAALAAAMEPVEYTRRDVVVREDEPGDDFFVITEGEVEVRKRLPGKRRSVTIGWLGPGECFGEIALLENTARTATIVASRRSRLLKLGRAPFEKLVVARLGVAPLREWLQHARFLGRLTFTAGWSFAALIKFARRCRSLRVDANTAVLTQGEQNHWFYLIYDGAFEAREGKRVLRRMGPGDYFGEISLLEGWPATATVVAVEESRCLALSRTEFLELFARDFRIGLRMEAVAAQRLGSDIFSSR